jgi:hypothetical protein
MELGGVKECWKTREDSAEEPKQEHSTFQQPRSAKGDALNWSKCFR